MKKTEETIWIVAYFAIVFFGLGGILFFLAFMADARNAEMLRGAP